MIEWVEELRAGFTEEFGTGPKVVTLATATDIGSPRVRTVVCRDVTDDGMLLVASDRRSEKNGEARHRPPAEVCVWLPTPRRQFRIQGMVSVLSASGVVKWHGYEREDQVDRIRGFRDRVWTELSESARALFFWPHPGRPIVRDPAQFPQAVRTGLPPDNFEVLCLSTNGVELLDLRPHPHRRREWSRDRDTPNWDVFDLNP